MKPPPLPFECPLVGVTHVDEYPSNLLALNDLAVHMFLDGRTSDGLFEYAESEGIPIRLQHDPDNEHDPNAIEVHCDLLEDMSFIGFIPAGLACRLPPPIDEYHPPYHGEICRILVHPDHPDNPGIRLKIFK